MPNLNLSARKDLEPYKTNHATEGVRTVQNALQELTQNMSDKIGKIRFQSRELEILVGSLFRLIEV